MERLCMTPHQKSLKVNWLQFFWSDNFTLMEVYANIMKRLVIAKVRSLSLSPKSNLTLHKSKSISSTENFIFFGYVDLFYYIRTFLFMFAVKPTCIFLLYQSILELKWINVILIEPPILQIFDFMETYQWFPSFFYFSHPFGSSMKLHNINLFTFTGAINWNYTWSTFKP